MPPARDIDLNSLETGFISSRLYSSAMGKNLIRVMKRNIPPIADQFEANPELSHIASEVDKLSRRGRHLRLKDVDECLTCHVGGMRKDRGGPFPLDGADDYYQWASSARFIKGVKRSVRREMI
jgi:predicted alpha/beta-fold hydrolase